MAKNISTNIYYTSNNDSVLQCSCLASDLSMYLHEAFDGYELTLKRTDNSNNKIIIYRANGGSINNSTSMVFERQNGVINLKYTNNTWTMVSDNINTLAYNVATEIDSQVNVAKNNNYEKHGVIIDTCEDETTLAVTNVTSSEIATTKKRNTGKSLKIVTANDGTAASVKKTISTVFGTAPKISFWIYMEDAVNCNNVAVWLGKNGSNFFYVNISSLSFGAGWNYFSIAPTDWETEGTVSWATDTMTFIDIKPRSENGETSTHYICDIRKNANYKPALVITFDDGWLSQYTEAYSYMKSKGIKGTIYFPQSYLGQTGIMSLSQLKEIYNDGWTIGNHSYSHNPLNNLSYGAVIAEMKSQKNWLIDNGMPLHAEHCAYPGGLYSDTVKTAMLDAGMKTGRIVTEGRVTNVYDPTEKDIFEIHNTSYITKDTSFATLKGVIDNTIKYGKTAFVTLHKIVQTASATEDYSINNFRAFIDYVASSGIECLTVADWYNKLDI